MKFITAIQPTRKFLIFGFVFLVSMIAFQVVQTKPTAAMFDRGAYQGFFTNSYATSGDYMHPGGIYVNSADEFINWYTSKANRTCSASDAACRQDKVIASFTIRSMMGARSGSAGERWSVSEDLINRWAENVRSYAQRGRIHFNSDYTFNKNTFYQEGSEDVSWYYDSGREPSIVFVHPDGKVYAIKKSCANTVGEIAPFPPGPPPPPDPVWELKDPVSQVSKSNNPSGDWSKKTVYVDPGTTVWFRHKIGNKGPDTANFQTHREYNDQADSGGSGQTIGPGGDRYVGSDAGGNSFFVPSNAPKGWRHCERQAVNPERFGGSGTLRDTYACVEAQPRDDDEPPDPVSPNFDIGQDCRTNLVRNVLRIENLEHPSGGHAGDNVAIRVRVFPHRSGSGIIISQNGTSQSSGTYTFANHGSFDVGWPSGYDRNIEWEVQARAYVYGRASQTPQNNTGSVVKTAVIRPCPSWDLTPSTSPVGGFIEQGGVVGFNHYVTNNDPFGMGGKPTNAEGCVLTNYSIYNPNGGNIGEYCSTIGQYPFGQGGNGPMSNNASILYTDGATPLGATYCQRYRVSPANEDSGGTRYSDSACTKIVGGKTYLSVQPADPPYVEPGKEGVITATTTTSQYTDAPGYTGYRINCSYDVVSYLPYGGTQNKKTNEDCSHDINSDGPRKVVEYKYRPTASEIGSKICLITRISASNGFLLDSRYTATPPPSCFDVITKPYTKVIGGDIAAGNCGAGTTSKSSIIGWNRLNDKEGPAGAGNFGAGTNFAVFAQGAIKGFASGQNLPATTGSGYGYAPNNLSFANAGSNAGTDNYGGDFAGTPCPLKYFAHKPTDPDKITAWPGMATAAATTYSTKSYSASGTITLDSVTINKFVNIRLYVDGDVIINGNILGNNAGAMDASQMASFTLYVKGNIYIQPNVTQLYGTYIAEPTSGSTKGDLYTCSNGTSPVGTTNYQTTPPAALTNPYRQCGSQLTFTGAVVAKKVHLLRTFGSLYLADSAAATQANAGEVFKYNPLSWIYGVTGPTTSNVDTYESITTLPPVL